MRGLLGDDLTTVGRAGGTGRLLNPDDSPPPPPPAAASSLLSMVRSMPFSRQSCRLRRKRLRLLDIEGEGGGDEEGAAAGCFGASPADWVLERSLLDGGTARVDDEVVVVVAADVVAATAAGGSSWLWVMLW